MKAIIFLAFLGLIVLAKSLPAGKEDQKTFDLDKKNQKITQKIIMRLKSQLEKKLEETNGTSPLTTMETLLDNAGANWQRAVKDIPSGSELMSLMSHWKESQTNGREKRDAEETREGKTGEELVTCLIICLIPTPLMLFCPAMCGDNNN